MTIAGSVASSNDGMSHSPERLCRPAVVLLLGTLVLVGCNVLNTLMPERAVRATLETLPEPEDVLLIDEVRRRTYGSDERCISAYTERLYGTELAFDDILTFYEENLPDDKWHKVEELSTPTWASPTKHFALAVHSDVHASLMPAESIKHARKQFSTLYALALSYVNNPDYCRAF